MRRAPAWATLGAVSASLAVALARALARRALTAAASLALVAALVFLAGELLADPAALRLGRGATPEALAAVRAELGLDQPFWTRLWEHVLGALSFDPGVSQVRGAPAGSLLAASLGPTLAYAVPGSALATALALGGGLLGAGARGSAGRWADRGLLALATVLMSTSSVIVVALGQHLLAHRLGLFPVLGWPLGGDASGAARFVVLPALLWALLQLGPDLRHYRAVFAHELAAPHLEGLRARGVPERAIARHVVRGAAAPVLARISSRLPHLVLGSVVIEQLFNIPGAGALLIAAVHEADLPLVQAIAVAAAAATIGGQALCDGLAWLLDPRLRRGDVP